MLSNVINNSEWKKIIAKEFVEYKQTRKLIREKLIKENYKEKKKIELEINKSKNTAVYKFKTKKEDKITEILSKSRSFCQNNYCFPIKENFIVSNCYTLKYIELFDNFEFFDKTMSNFFTKISGLYEFYPKTLDEKERLDNKGFILWMFITYIKYLISKNFCFNKKEDVVQLIKNISEMLNKDFKYLYVFLVKYLIKVNDYFKQKKNNNTLSDYFNYRKYYCPVCKQYLCNKHYYKSFRRSDLNNNDKNYFFIESEVSSCYAQETNYIRTKTTNNNNNTNIIKPNPLNIITCSNCKFNINNINTNIKNINKNNSLCIELNSNEENIFQLISQMSKDDFYLLNIFILFGLNGNNCFFNLLFNNKYPCPLLKNIITFCSNFNNLYSINNYLINKNYGTSYPPLINSDIKTLLNNPKIFRLNFPTEEERQFVINEIHSKFGYLKSKKRGGYHCNHLGACYNNPECECNISRSFCDKFCICSNDNCYLLFKGCSCKDKCNNIYEQRDLSNCPCIKEGRECDPEICINCKHCNNTKAFDKIFKKTRLSQSVIIDGAGLFAAEEIKKNELIDKYIGEVIEKEEVERRSTINIPFERNYAFELDDYYDIDATRYGNKMRYINQSSFGYENCYARNVIVRGNTEILFYAKRDIKKGEEIYLDYHMNNCTWLNKYNRLYGSKKK